MPLYYFHLIECGELVIDPEGLELVNIEAARASATRAARDVMASEVKEGRISLSCCVVVENEWHQEIDRLPFANAVTLHSC